MAPQLPDPFALLSITHHFRAAMAIAMLKTSVDFGIALEHREMRGALQTEDVTRQLIYLLGDMHDLIG